MDNKDRYTYGDAGFNGFLNRGLRAQSAATLRSLSMSVPRQELNFDHIQTSGNLGDKIQVGGIRLDGTNRRIVIVDELDIEVGWIGNIGD